MDAVEVDNLHSVTPLRTWIAGCKVAEDNKSLLSGIKPAPINLFNARTIKPSDLDVKYIGQKIRVIKALDGELLTEEIVQIPKVQNQTIVADPDRDILLLTVVNRYRPAKPAMAFILKTAVEYIPANKNQHKLDKVNWVM
jgi:adenine deaminase